MTLSETGRCGQKSWRRRRVGLSAAGAVLAMFVPGEAQATESGGSLYLHGSGGPGTAVMAPLEGVYFDKITWVYDGDAGIERELPINGRVVAGVDLTVVAEFATMLFVPSTDFLGGTFALGVTLPYGAPMLDAAGVLERPGGGSLSASVHDTALTTGDPVGVAMLGWKEGDLHLQVSSMVNVPIGHFRESGLANLSLHRWAVDTSMAASWHDAEAGWDLSVKGGYTFNGSNETNGYDSGDGLGSLGPGPAPGLGGVEGLVPRATTLRVISTSDASGKSSSWFFCSRDSRFLVKTCTAKERDVLLDILGEYSKHASEHRGTSLLPQYYGLYTIEVGSRSAHFIIMNYWFATMHEISVRYDLKGSTKGRRASAKERAKGAAAVLKDLDFAESGEVVINPMAEDVKRAVANDIEFLERNRLIDYSMMLGLHYKKNKDGGDDDRRRERQRESLGDGELGDVATAAETEASEPEPPSPLSRAHRAARAAQSTESLGPFAEAAADDDRTQFQLRALETPFGLAYLGIIDILTQYGVAKAAENLCFGALMCGADISCQPPDAYARRFRTFIDRVLVAPAAAAAEGGDEGEAEDAGAERGRRSVRSLDAEMERAAERDGADAR